MIAGERITGLLSLAAAVVFGGLVVAGCGSSHPGGSTIAPATNSTTAATTTQTTAPATTQTTAPATTPSTTSAPVPPRKPAGPPPPSLAKMIGQQVMVMMNGTTPDEELLNRIRHGQVGG